MSQDDLFLESVGCWQNRKGCSRMWVSLDNVFSLLSISLPTSFPLSLRAPPHPTSPASSESPRPPLQPDSVWLSSLRACHHPAALDLPCPKLATPSADRCPGPQRTDGVGRGEGSSRGVPSRDYAGQARGVLGGGSEGLLCSRFHVTERWHLIFQIRPVLC